MIWIARRTFPHQPSRITMSMAMCSNHGSVTARHTMLPTATRTARLTAVSTAWCSTVDTSSWTIWQVLVPHYRGSHRSYDPAFFSCGEQTDEHRHSQGYSEVLVATVLWSIPQLPSVHSWKGHCMVVASAMPVKSLKHSQKNNQQKTLLYDFDKLFNMITCN